MFLIKFRTRTYRPDASITIRTETDGWGRGLPGSFGDDQWVFELDEREYPDGLVFKFVLDGRRWMAGVNLRVDQLADGAERVFDESEVVFENGLGLLVENGAFARRFFAPAFPDQGQWDVIVVGSGMGGGIVADQLSDLGKRVLVLEAGSYLFPTHVANLPRPHLLGQFDKHVWALWSQFGIRNYQLTAGSNYDGAQGPYLGGRSLFWGGLAPRMTEWELRVWPTAVRNWLRATGYRQAEEVLRAKPVPSSQYGDRIKRLLRIALPDFDHIEASMALQYSSPFTEAIPTGLFSTADLLTESRLTPGPTGAQNLTINLNHRVDRIEHAGGVASGVICRDLIADVERVFTARSIIVAAGSIETVRLLTKSGIAQGSANLGKGLTDHPIFYTHFGIPADSPYYAASDSSKTLSRHAGARQEHPYNMVLEIGADFNQGRYLDDDIVKEHLKDRHDLALAEIVFLFDSPLLGTNQVIFPNDAPESAAVISMLDSPSADQFIDDAKSARDRIFEELRAVGLPNDDLAFHRARLGGVAHEAGSARMSEGEDGVVDADMLVRGTENVFLCDLSVFPSSPAANPSLTLAALALRLAQHLANP